MKQSNYRCWSTARRWCVGSTALTAIGVIAIAGCGGKHGATVTGKISLDGEPVPRGSVAYFPVAGGPPAVAQISEQGEYRLRTGRDPSLPPGDYQVTVAANEPPREKRSADGGPPPPGPPITPTKYRSKATSGLQYTVESGGNTIDIELTSDAT